MCGDETLTLGKVDQKYRESSDLLSWRMLQKISLADRVRNVEVLHRVKEQRNVLHTIERRLIRLVTACVGTAF